MFNINNKSFENWLGKEMAEIVANTHFELSHVEDSLFSHVHSQGVHIDKVDPDPENRERVLQHYLKFYEEISEKLQIEAAVIAPRIVIRPDFTTEMLDVVRVLLERAMSGDKNYVYHLGDHAFKDWEEYENQKPEDYIRNYTRSVEIIVKFGIANALDGLPQELMWVASAEAWELDEKDPDKMRHVCTIEVESIYLHTSPPASDEEEDDGE
jgi:hypothetical protein